MGYVLMVMFVVVVIVAILWVGGMSDMKEKHPDYNGEDLFNEDKDKNIK